MGAERGAGQAGRAERSEIEELVEAVNGHARTLANLASSLRKLGVVQTRRELTGLMEEMERQFPGSREKSVFASVALSLKRMSAENQQRVSALGLFHGGVDLDVLRHMMEWDEAAVGSLGAELVGTGLATVDPYNHLTLNAALCPYLRGRLTTEELSPLTARWVEAMVGYVRFLEQQRSQQTEVAATLTLLELPNLFGVLEQVRGHGDAERTIALATSLYGLLQFGGKPRLVDRVGEIRDEAERSLGEAWNHARFDGLRTRIEQQLAGGDLQAAFEGARTLLERARRAGEQTYPAAEYDLGIACFLLARVLRIGGAADRALPLLEEARERFKAVEQKQPGCGAERMASACYTEMGDCYRGLGQYDEAEAAYSEAIARDKKRNAERDVAVGQGQLGTVYLQQRKFGDALQAYQEARETFTRLNEPESEAVIWHQTGRVHQEAGQFERAEQAYRESLRITVQQKDRPRQARTLHQLGHLYDDWIRLEDAVVFYRQAAEIEVAIQDLASEGLTRSNLANTLRKLQLGDEARQEILRAIECKSRFGHASEPWKTWDILADIETATGNAPAAAEARQKGRNAYLAYRRDGGENHNGDGRLALQITRQLQGGESDAAKALLAKFAALPNFGNMLPFIRTLQAIVAGSRDRSLADDPELHYTQYAEIVLLLDTLDAVP
jgi:tetratricopeptide (TPR) repeat protein